MRGVDTSLIISTRYHSKLVVFGPPKKMSPPEQHKKVIRGRHHSLYHTHTHTWWSVGRDIYSEEEEEVLFFFFFLFNLLPVTRSSRALPSERDLFLLYVCVCIFPCMASMDIREKRRRIYSISGGFHIFLFWPELRLNITFFLPRNKKKMFTTRKVYSPYGISYTQKKKRTLKMFEKKNIKKKNLEGAPSSLVVVGPDLLCAPLL